MVNKLDNQIIKQLLHGVITKHHISVVQIIFLPQPLALSCSPITNNDTLSHNIATTYGGQFTLSTQLKKPNHLFIIPTYIALKYL